MKPFLSRGSSGSSMRARFPGSIPAVVNPNLEATILALAAVRVWERLQVS